jgi:hypothetical protein
LYRAYHGERARFLAISQDDAPRTRSFLASENITLPFASDAEDFPISNEYGITRVPTYYLISPAAEIRIASVGFSKSALAAISAELATFLGRPADPVFLPGEIIPDSRDGCGSKN